MQQIILNLAFAVLGSLIAWASTAWLNDRFKRQPGWVHVSVVACLASIWFLVAVRIETPTSRISKPSVVVKQPVAAEDKNSEQTGGERNPPTQNRGPEDVFLARYVNTVPLKRAAGQWAVVIVDNNFVISGALSGAIVKELTAKGDKSVPVFRGSILSNIGYKELYNADSALLQKLHNFCDGIIVARLEETTAADDTVQGLVTVRQTLNVRVFLTKSGVIAGDFQISEKGGGFSQETARNQAIERIAERLRARLRNEIQ